MLLSNYQRQLYAYDFKKNYSFKLKKGIFFTLSLSFMKKK